MSGTIYRNNVSYGINISDSQPVGQIIDSASDSVPAGYLPCDGRSLLRSDYPDLFKKIGTKYGAEDDEHFNLPSEEDVALVLKSEMPQYIELGSQVLYPSYTTSTTNLNTPVLTAYNRDMISGFFLSDIPAGYKLMFYLTAQCTTNSGMTIGCHINNYAPTRLARNSWSSTAFRVLTMSSLFNRNAIPYEKAYGYNNNGLNLYIETNSTAGTASIYNITIHAVAVKE